MIRILALSVFLGAGPASAQAPFAAPQTASQAPAASSTAELAARSSTAEPQAPAPAQVLSRRWSFLEAAAKNDDYAGAESAMIDDLNLLVSQSRAASDAAQARFLAASLEEREGLHEQAMVDLLHLLYEFPNADVSMQAQSMFQDIAKKRLPGRYKGAVANISQAAPGSSADDRLAALIHLLVQNFGTELYGPIRGEIRGFMARFPDYSGMDRVQWDLVSLDEAVENRK